MIPWMAEQQMCRNDTSVSFFGFLHSLKFITIVFVNGTKDIKFKLVSKPGFKPFYLLGTCAL